MPLAALKASMRAAMALVGVLGRDEPRKLPEADPTDSGVDGSARGSAIMKGRLVRGVLGRDEARKLPEADL